MKNKLLLAFTTIFILLSCTKSDENLSESSKLTLYKKATAYLVDDKFEEFNKIREKLTDYNLSDYLDYFYLEKVSLNSNDTSKIDSFLTKNKSNVVGKKMLRKWLNHALKQKKYELVAKYQVHPEFVASRCQVLQAKIKLGQTVDYKKNQDIWLYGSSRPSTCDPVFSYWKKTGAIDNAEYDKRAKIAFEKGNYKLAKQMVKDDTLIKEKLANRLQRRQVISRSTNYKKNAYMDLLKLPKKLVNDDVRKWRANQMIFNGYWDRLLKEIVQMPPEQYSKDVWQYWFARGLQKLNKNNLAEQVYEKLSLKTTYYGFLSADRLDKPYNICGKDSKSLTNNFSETFMKKYYERNPGIKMALDLRLAGSTSLANSEWNFAMKDLNYKDKLVAASLAAKIGWHIKAIIVLGKLREFQYYDLRFPLKWRDLVDSNSKLRNLEPSYIYAIMRTESAMRPNAISHVGARGLMQVMPTTASRVAEKYKLPGSNDADMLQPVNNIAIGSAYLHQMSKRWSGQTILMTASYNAGPNNVKRWVKKLPKEADRFIELIPYAETRKYVMRVLDYATMYSWRMGEDVVRISQRISNVGGNAPFIKTSSATAKVTCLADK